MNYCKEQDDSRTYHKQQPSFPLQSFAQIAFHGFEVREEERKTAFKGDAPHFIKGVPGNMVVLTKTSQNYNTN